MELPELQEGLQNIEHNMTPSDAIDLPPDSDTPWELNADSMRDAFGSWYGNDEGLGEMFLTQLRAHNVDTKAATEAMLRELLSGLVNDMNLLQSKLSGFMSELSKQTQKAQAVVDSAQATIDASNPDASALNVQMPSGAMPQFNDLAIDSGMDGEMPPEAGAGEMPPEGTPSDARIKYVLSDARLKKIKTKLLSNRKPKGKGISSNIIAACNRGF